jgi:hypothetical protein
MSAGQGSPMGDDAYLQAALADVQRVLGAPIHRLLVSVIQTKFLWLTTGRIVWARTKDLRHALFWVVPGRAPAHLNGPDGLSHLSEMLTSSTGPLPHGLSPLLLGEAVRQLTFDPRGVVGTPEYLRSLGPGIQHWLKSADPADQRLFEAQCAGPRLQVQDDGAWSLELECFNVGGGVERWQIGGDARQISRAESVLAVPDGTFRWPMA